MLLPIRNLTYANLRRWIADSPPETFSLW